MLWTAIETPHKSYRRIWLPSADGESLSPKTSSPASGLKVFYFTDAHGHHLSASKGLENRLAHVSFERERCAEDTLLLDGGDDFGGGEISDAIMGDFSDSQNHLYSLLNYRGVDAICPGNHDFDWGTTTYVDKLPADAPLVTACNVTPTSPLADRLPEIVLFEFSDKRVAVLGLANLNHVPHASDDFMEGIDALPEHLKNAHEVANIVIVISHNGTSYDRAIQESLSPEVLLCGGHTHQTIPEATLGFVASNYLQSGSQLECFGLAQWQPQSPWKVANFPIEKAASPTDQTPIETTLSKNVNRIVSRAGRVQFDQSKLASEDPLLDRYRGNSAALGWATDQIAASVEASDTSPRLAALCCAYMANRRLSGSMSLADWYQVFPYADQLYEIRIPWTGLAKLLELNARRLTFSPGYRIDIDFLHFSKALSYEVGFRKSRPEIKSITVNGKAYTEGEFETMTLLTHAYVVSGSGGFKELFSSLGIWPLPSCKPVANGRDLLWSKAKDPTGSDVETQTQRVSIDWRSLD